MNVSIWTIFTERMFIFETIFIWILLWQSMLYELLEVP